MKKCDKIVIKLHLMPRQPSNTGPEVIGKQKSVMIASVMI